jgi:hypothetical protein
LANWHLKNDEILEEIGREHHRRELGLELLEALLKPALLGVRVVDDDRFGHRPDELFAVVVNLAQPEDGLHFR